MPTVKLNITLSGTSNGVPWPEAGALVRVDDDEAARLVAVGHGEVVEDDDEAEVVDLVPPVYEAQVEADGTAKVERSKPAKRETRKAD